MAYCRYCGAQIHDGDKKCPECGKRTEDTAYSVGTRSEERKIEYIGCGIVGLLMPIAGLVCYIMWKNERPKCAKAAAVGAIAGAVIRCLIYLFWLVFALTIPFLIF